MKKFSKQLTSCILALALATTPAYIPLAQDTQTASAASVTSLTVAPSRVSVHDPSITEAADGTYYAFGSHIDAARSTDLVNWTYFTNGYNSTNNAIFGDLSKNLAKPFKWAGEDDVDSKGGYSVWAPDVFYNKDYINEDGTKGAYMMYFCTTSTYKRSVLAFGVSQNIEGPYTCVDTLIYSGFTKNSANDFGSKINTKYTNTNIQELIDNGTLKDGINSEWFNSDGSYRTSYAPNAIDPTVFYDKNGKLWMTYGSWSGGIFVIEIDPATGKAIYPGTSSVTKDGLVVDAYFGTRISGGLGKSGEGPYIIYDAETDYYYLYVSYEGLVADAGYHMRLYRSKNPDGPYLDAAGNSAVMTTGTNDEHYKSGIKVMGNYTFSSLEKAYKAPGHNSALIDEDRQKYLIYHTRFENWGEVHQVRVHQQFANEAGWPVTAVFENKGDRISETGYTADDTVGEYEFINHGLANDGASVTKPENIKLNADGTISGDITGTWKAKAGSYYMEAVIDGVTYSGVFFAQHDESAACNKVMTFTAIGTDNQTIWGVKKELFKISDAEAVERAVDELENSNIIKPKTITDLELPVEASNSAKITWSSNNEAIISSDGKVTRPEKATDVILSAVVAYGSASFTKSFTTTVADVKASPDYIYDFETVNGTEVAGTVKDTSPALLAGSASVSKDPLAGNILVVKNSADGQGKNYLSLPADIFKKADLSGFTVSMWVKCGSSSMENQALFEAKSSSSYDSLPMTALHAGAYADYRSHEATVNGSIGLAPEPGIWTHLVYTVSADGIKVYANGILRTENAYNLTPGLDNKVLSQIDDIRIGSGTLSESTDIADASFDDIEFYSVALDGDTILAKYEEVKNSHPDLKLSASRKTIYAGGDTNNTSQLSTKCSTDLEHTVAYQSSDDTVASVDGTGLVTAIKEGTATITATITANGETFNRTKKITVKKAYLKFSSKKTSLKVKKTATYKVKGYGLKANKIKWTSSKPAVLSIKQNGKATAKKAGTATITAKYSGFKVSVKVKVKK